MAEAPVKDVFADDEPDDDQRVVDEAEEAEQQREAEEAATKAGTDDIEVVLAEAEEAEPEDDEVEAEPEVKAEADDDMPVEDEVDEDLKSYSKKVQDRIARERRLVKRAREEAAAAVSGERAKRIDAERKSLTAHKNLTAVLLVNIESQLKAKSTELKALLEQGDADGKQVDIQGELDDLRAKKREIESAKVSLDSQAEEFERQAKIVPAETPQATPATQNWLGQNKWFGKKGFAAETLLVRDLDIRLATTRMDKGSPEYFVELNRQIKAEMPDLAVKVKRAFKPVSGNRSAVAPVSRTGAVRTDSAGKRRVMLDKMDLQNMRDHKLDPTNKDHVARYAREKMAAQ